MGIQISFIFHQLTTTMIFKLLYFKKFDTFVDFRAHFPLSPILRVPYQVTLRLKRYLLGIFYPRNILHMSAFLHNTDIQ